MGDYVKTLTPPEGLPFLETADGLKYWRVDHGPKLGCQQSVLTEDASISMHEFGGGRERGPTFLFNFKGFKTGFFCQDSNQGHYPWWDLPFEADKDANTVTFVVSGIGTPVWDEEATMIPDGKGGVKADIAARARGEGYVTGLTFKDYNEGKRTKFESREQQDAMLKIMPDLFTGLMGNLRHLEPGARQGPKRLMRLSDQLAREVEVGELINVGSEH